MFFRKEIADADNIQKGHFVRERKQRNNNISLGPQVAVVENVFDVCYIFASCNDAFVHITDLSGNETICRWNEGKR